jgi:hypothetical protein
MSKAKSIAVLRYDGKHDERRQPHPGERVSHTA